MQFFLSILAAMVVAMPAAPRAQAQGQDEMTWYAIEIIIFERTSELGRNAEAWPAEPGFPEIADAVELSREGLVPEEPAGELPNAAASETAPATVPADESNVPPSAREPRAFQVLPPEAYRLTDAWNRLNKSSAYRPLLHMAWIQPGFASEDARMVHVRNNNAALGTIATPIATRIDGDDEMLPVFDEPGDAPTLSARIQVARDPGQAAVDGTLRVHRARYLHVKADLLYYRPLDSDASAPVPPGSNAAAAPLPDSPDTALIELLLAEEDAAPRLFRLTESRRMRSAELHYLDHPLFGLLVEAWPVELPEAPPPAAPLAEGDDVTTGESSAGEPAAPPPAPTEGSGG
jgi:hypothetical protein